MLESAFKKYVSNYDINNPKIRLKYNHSFRVMELSVKYATMLGFSHEDIEIARCIGLLHDIGRFEQLKVYDTFNDSISVDHADYSVDRLFNHNEIEMFGIPEEWYGIIKFAIKNHNKLKIEDCDDSRYLMHAKLIRDVDKLDIVYLLGYLGELSYSESLEPISKEVMDAIKKHESVSKTYVKSENDQVALKIAFPYDIYNDCVLDEFRTNLDGYMDRVNKHGLFNEVYEIVNKYIDERIG